MQFGLQPLDGAKDWVSTPFRLTEHVLRENIHTWNGQQGALKLTEAEVSVGFD